jgi:aspartate carbamoyltransferase regulatory subunit
MIKNLSVSAIKNGTVIDHIHAGQAFGIIKLLKILGENKNQVTIGMNLPSKLLGHKDLIKIENRILTKNEADEVAIFAKEITINLIKNFNVIQKIKTHLPKSISHFFICPNPVCITHSEPIGSKFHIKELGNHVKLICHYCEKSFDRDQVQGNVHELTSTNL